MSQSKQFFFFFFFTNPKKQVYISITILEIISHTSACNTKSLLETNMEDYKKASKQERGRETW